MNATGVGSGNTHKRGWRDGSCYCLWLAVKEISQAEPKFSFFHKMPLRCLLCGAQAAQHTGLWRGQCIELRPSWGGSWRLLFVCIHIHNIRMCPFCNLMSRCSGKQRLLTRKQVQRKAMLTFDPKSPATDREVQMHIWIDIWQIARSSLPTVLPPPSTPPTPPTIM